MKVAMRGGGSASATGAGVRWRAVEAGARLLAAPPGDYHVIMQLPRGNLETIAPRRLLLSCIAAALQVRGPSSPPLPSLSSWLRFCLKEPHPVAFAEDRARLFSLWCRDPGVRAGMEVGDCPLQGRTFLLITPS